MASPVIQVKPACGIARRRTLTVRIITAGLIKDANGKCKYHQDAPIAAVSRKRAEHFRIVPFGAAADAVTEPAYWNDADREIPLTHASAAITDRYRASPRVRLPSSARTDDISGRLTHRRDIGEFRGMSHLTGWPVLSLRATLAGFSSGTDRALAPGL